MLWRCRYTPSRKNDTFWMRDVVNCCARPRITALPWAPPVAKGSKVKPGVAAAMSSRPVNPRCSRSAAENGVTDRGTS